MQNQPRDYDVTLGGFNPCTSAVLGGLEGVKQRLTNGGDECSSLIEALRYGEDGEDLVRNYFNHPDHSQFFIDMVAAGKNPSISEQRLEWFGPSVQVSNKKELQRIIRSTSVDLVWDNAGKEGAVIYPAAYSPSKLRHLWLLTHVPEDPEAQSIALGIEIYLKQGEPLCSLAQNLLEQLENFSI